jgi:type I restriction enzyme, S subunit
LTAGVLEEINWPEDWQAVPFGRLVDRRKECGQADLRPLSVFLDEGVVPRDSRDDNFNRLGSDMSLYLLVEPGDIVFNKLRTWQGGLGVSEHRGIVSPAYFVCRPHPGLVSRFLHYVLRSRPYLQELARVSKWMPPSQFDISWEDLREVAIWTPPMGVQVAIANYLDAETVRIDRLMAMRRRMRDLLELRLEVLVRTLTDSTLEGLAHERVPLKRRWRVIDCKHRTPTYVPIGYPVVSPGDAIAGWLDLSRCHRFVDAPDYADLTEGVRKPQRGDIVYTRNASIGIASYVDTDDPFTMGQDVCLIRSEEQDQRFLTYVLNTHGVDQLEEQKIGSTFSRINVAQVLELVIPCPDVTVQRAIADRLDAATADASRARTVLDSQSDLLVERRQALITAAVTGQLEIPGVAA